MKFAWILFFLSWQYLRANDIGLLPLPLSFRCRHVLNFHSQERDSTFSNSRLLEPLEPGAPPRYLIGVLVELRDGTRVLIKAPYTGANHAVLIKQLDKFGWTPDDVTKILWAGEMEFSGAHITKINEFSGSVKTLMDLNGRSGYELVANKAAFLVKFLQDEMPGLLHPELDPDRDVQPFRYDSLHLHPVTALLPPVFADRHNAGNLFAIAIGNAENAVTQSQADPNLRPMALDKVHERVAEMQPYLDLLPRLVEPSRAKVGNQNEELDRAIEILKSFLNEDQPGSVPVTNRLLQVHRAIKYVFQRGYEDPEGHFEISIGRRGPQ